MAVTSGNNNIDSDYILVLSLIYRISFERKEIEIIYHQATKKVEMLLLLINFWPIVTTMLQENDFDVAEFPTLGMLESLVNL